MCDFKPGDEVVCIRGGDWLTRAPKWMFWTRSRPCDGPVQGQVYTVERVGEGTCDVYGAIRIGVALVGVPRAWHISRFRKVQRRDLSAWLKTAAKNTDRLDTRTPAKEGV